MVQMVALSMADGFARLTNKPQCVIVHVDVGTQGLGAAVHNASCGRCPVLIFAGLSPYTIEGEYRGSRTEYIHWIQDVPDQKQIVAQYCRYTGEIKRGRNVKQMVNRALQFATSDPQGPVYLYGSREAMEEDIEPYSLNQNLWNRVTPSALPQDAVELISKHLVDAKEPLLVVGYTGRNIQAVHEAVELANVIPGLRVLDTGGSDMCFPADHPASLGLRYGQHDAIKTADFILVVDCDVPWINTQCKPREDAKIIHIDVDVLKQQMPTFYINAFERYKADAASSFKQIHTVISSSSTFKETSTSEAFKASADARSNNHRERLISVKKLAELPSDHDAPLNASFLGGQLKDLCPEDTIFVVEAVTLTALIADQIRPSLPKSWINCGGGGLGWSGGAALGIKLASDFISDNGKGKFICHIVGDGTFIFSVPSAVYWISQRYNIPILTVVLNNKGWNAPRRSLLLVHPDGEGSRADNKALNISFDPTPDYAGIAKAAAGGRCWAGCVRSVNEMINALPKAIEAVKGGTCAVLEVQLDAEPKSKTRTHLNGIDDGVIGQSSG
jgi:thiamine pyrophosphate-dependent acetolactate synthase large subunit-like protein